MARGRLGAAAGGARGREWWRRFGFIHRHGPRGVGISSRGRGRAGRGCEGKASGGGGEEEGGRRRRKGEGCLDFVDFFDLFFSNCCCSSAASPVNPRRPAALAAAPLVPGRLDYRLRRDHAPEARWPAGAGDGREPDGGSREAFVAAKVEKGRRKREDEEFFVLFLTNLYTSKTHDNEMQWRVNF